MSIPPSKSVVLILGPPGSGKGSCSAALAPLFGAYHISSGDEMRKAQDDPVQRQIMEAGDLVGEDRFQTVISRAILQAPQDIPLILDGVAKRPKEAPWLVDFLGKHGYEIVFVIHLDLDQATAAKRNQDRTDNRQDDDPTKQAMRRKLYDIETMQSIRWFCENFPHVRIDGNNTREAIVAQARTALEEHLPLAA